MDQFPPALRRRPDDAGRRRGRHRLAGTVEHASQSAASCRGRRRYLPHQRLLRRRDGEVEVSPQAAFTSAAPTPLRGRRVLASSQVRDQRFAYLLSKVQRLGPDELTALMSDHGPTGEPDADSLACIVPTGSRPRACKFCARSRRMRVAYDSTCRAVPRLRARLSADARQAALCPICGRIAAASSSCGLCRPLTDRLCRKSHRMHFFLLHATLLYLTVLGETEWGPA